MNFEHFQKYEINIAWIHPKVLSFLCEDSIVQKYDISCLRILYTGGRALSQNQIQAVRVRLPYAVLRQVYGMVEMAYVANQTDDHCSAGSVGVLQPGVNGKIIDVKTGHVLGSNRYGEIYFRGPVVMKRYIRDSSVIDSDGWFHSGDIGYYNENQEWYLVCRKSDLIDYNEQIIVPSVLENILNQFDDIKECSIVGIPNEKCGETPVAFIVKSPESLLSEKDFRNIIKSNKIYNSFIYVKFLNKFNSFFLRKFTVKFKNLRCGPH